MYLRQKQIKESDRLCSLSGLVGDDWMIHDSGNVMNGKITNVIISVIIDNNKKHEVIVMNEYYIKMTSKHFLIPTIIANVYS